MRYDVCKLDSPRQRTSNGFLRTTGRLTRCGILTYQTPDGPRRELRPPDEVFSRESLDSLASVLITDLHPGDMVNAGNAKGVQVGFVGEVIKHDSQYINGSLTFTDQTVISKIDAGERKELSPGYKCRMDFTPGVYRGRKYDAVQRDIRYNHIAILPEGAGRSGSEVRIDGEQCAWPEEDEGQNKQETTSMKLRIDGLEYDADSDVAAQALTRYTAKCDSDMAESKTKNETLQAKLDAGTKALEELKAKFDAATDPAELEKRIAARVALVTKATKILGDEAKFDGKSDKDIKLECLAKTNEGVDFTSKTDDYLDAYFDIAADKTDSTTKSGVGGGRKVPEVKKDADDKVEDKYDADAARERMILRNTTAWQQPLTRSLSA